MSQTINKRLEQLEKVANAKERVIVTWDEEDNSYWSNGGQITSEQYNQLTGNPALEVTLIKICYFDLLPGANRL